jgi:tetratricopeptide (TPR) repeat protein
VPTHHIEAYDFYLRARQFFYQGRRRDLENARQMFRRALDIDSSYARAYAGVADCCSFLSKWFHVKEDNLRDALAASGTAVELDPECAEARASLGLAEFLNGNYDHAENQFEIALGFDPGLFEASYFYGRSCFAQGQFVKAASLFTRASHACPDDYQAPSLLGLCLRAMGRTTEAAAAFRECLQKAEKHLELHPDDVRAVSLGSNALCGMGDDERALEWTNRALEMDPEEASVLYNVGCSYALLNQTGKALDCLTKALRKGFCHKAWLEHDPDLDSLRHHPRFISLMESFEENLICSG